MEIYMVGGAVRDMLLGRPVKERDFVVVGATPEEMLAMGYHQVGRDFPVFLHPDTKEEYALARGERRRLGKGRHPGVYIRPEVTLEQDLERRDLTVNAIAMDQEGRVIDPYQGRRDLERKVLRHVSGAFAEDPVRVLRVARFAARYGELGFRVAGETIDLMSEMVVKGEVDGLVPERVWQELIRALGEPQPHHFFQVLGACGAWRRLFPEIPDDGRAIAALGRAVELSPLPEVRFAAVAGSLIVPPGDCTENDESAAVRQVEALCTRLRAPRRFYELALLTARHCGRTCQGDLSPSQMLDLFEETDAMRRPDRFRRFLTSCEAILGRAGDPAKYAPQVGLLAALDRVCGLDIPSLVAGEHEPGSIKDRIRQRRMEVIRGLRGGPWQESSGDGSGIGSPAGLGGRQKK